MGTAYSDVFDSFMTHIKDWRLETLFLDDLATFEDYLTGFLSTACDKFTSCNQDLTRDDTSKEFDVDLSSSNIIMLAKLMVEYWLEKEIQDIRQMSLHVQDKDFKTFAEANNLQQKSTHLDKVKETNSQALVDYAYRENDWSNWLSGNFYTP